MVVIGIDWGEKRVGVAVSDPAGIVAVPMLTLEVTRQKDLFNSIKAICEEKEAEKIVVGIPINMDGSKGPMCDKVEAFIQRLSDHISIPVEKWDERMSTMTADKALIEADMDNRKRKAVRDKLAAQVILQGYLDASAF